jgi:formylmethanofuran dehydrogenase subunit E
LKPGAIQLSDRHRELVDKIRKDTATEAEREEFISFHEKKCRDILQKPLEELFSLQEKDAPIPAKAAIEPSKPCERCGEPTMASKLTVKKGLRLCQECLDRNTGGRHHDTAG